MMYNKAINFFYKDKDRLVISSNFNIKKNKLSAICDDCKNHLPKNTLNSQRNIALEQILEVEKLLTVIKAREIFGLNVLDEKKYTFVLASTQLFLSGRLSQDQYIKAAKHFPGAAYNIYISVFLAITALACFITAITLAYILTGTTMLATVLGGMFGASVLSGISAYLQKENDLASLASNLFTIDNSKIITKEFCYNTNEEKYDDNLIRSLR